METEKLYTDSLEEVKLNNILEVQENDNSKKKPEKVVQCSQCSETFLSTNFLQVHVHLYHRGKYECPDCDLAFHYKHKLRKHYQVHDGLYCQRCNKTFKNIYNYSVHMKQHPSEYICKICKKSFTLKWNFVKHMYIHSSVKPSEPFVSTPSLTYKCDQCEKSFTAKVFLEEHLKEHKTEKVITTTGNHKVFVCKECGKVFAFESSLISHYYLHIEDERLHKEDEELHKEDEYFHIEDEHFCKEDEDSKKVQYKKVTREKIFNCNFCNRSFTLISRLKKHKLWHELGIKIPTFSNNTRPKKIQKIKKQKTIKFCKTCNKRFATSSNLKRHMDEHSETGKSRFTCKVCHKKFSRNCQYQKHMYTHDPKSYSLFKCDRCNKLFLNINYLNQHVKNCQVYKCSDCLELFYDLSKFSDHISTHSNIKCDICEQPFTKEIYLFNHMQLHVEVYEGRKPFLCTKCKQHFFTIDQFKCHLVKMHGLDNEKLFSCSICYKLFPRLPDLNIHMFRHSDVKRYKCNYCEKSYSRRDCFLNHVELHKNNQLEVVSHRKTNNENVKFTCATCKKMFVDKKKLANHMRVHKMEVKCNLCNKTFYQVIHLFNHMQLHVDLNQKGFKCTLCKVSYPDLHDFKEHLKDSHGLEKVLHCSFCCRLYVKKNELANHLYSHSTIKRHKCSKCEKSFTRKYSLTKHTTVNHPEEGDNLEDVNEEEGETFNQESEVFIEEQKCLDTESNTDLKYAEFDKNLEISEPKFDDSDTTISIKTEIKREGDYLEYLE